MPSFILYCDDSGTHDQSEIAVASCIIATPEQWEMFIRDWEWVNTIEDFGVFHMADFVSKHKQFSSAEWQDQEKRDRTLKRLINLINTRKRITVGAAVNKADYDAEVPEDLRERFKLGKNHYTFAVRACMGRILKWRSKYGYKDGIQFVFDQMSKGTGEINAVFEQALREPKEIALEHGIYEGCWSFQSKRTQLPLQAADILAWENFHYMQKVILAESKEQPRRSYVALAERAFEELGFYERESLRKLVAHVRQRTSV